MSRLKETNDISSSQSSSGNNIPEESYYYTEEETNDTNPEQDPQKPSPLNSLFRLMINPTEGWKILRRRKFQPEQTASRCFYPLMALASISVFIDALYFDDATLTQLLVKALIVFISFFFGYFLLIPLCKVFLPKEVKNFPETEFGKNFNMMMLSTLAIFYIISQCLPMFDAIWVFLPLWTIYLISKGARFIKASQKSPVTITFILCVLVIGTPLGVFRLFSIILPQ